VPGMGKVGIATIAGAGFVMKQSKKKLSVLSDISKAQCTKAKKISKLIDVEIAKNCNPVYVKVVATDKSNNVCDVLIEEEHDFIKQIKFNNKIISSTNKTNIKKQSDIQFNFNEISLKDIYDAIQEMNENELSFLFEGIKMNEAVVKYGKDSQEFKLVSVGDKEHTQQNILTVVTQAISARMSGCPLPVMASCDSGDHGLTVALPQYVYHQERKTSVALMLKAVALANLIT
jgi:L-cysteine desulfidase